MLIFDEAVRTSRLALVITVDFVDLWRILSSPEAVAFDFRDTDDDSVSVGHQLVESMHGVVARLAYSALGCQEPLVVGRIALRLESESMVSAEL